MMVLGLDRTRMLAWLLLRLGKVGYGGAGGLPGKLSTASHRPCPSEELPVAKTLLAGGKTLVTLWIGPITAETLPAAVVAGLGRRLD
jgi:hypothetical protein